MAVLINKNTKHIRCFNLIEDDDGLTNVLLPIEKEERILPPPTGSSLSPLKYTAYNIHVKDYDEVTNLSDSNPSIQYEKSTGSLKCIGITASESISSL